MTTIAQLREQALRDIRANPRPEDFSAAVAAALERARQNPTEFLRAWSHKDSAELGRLFAYEIDTALLARADREARELAKSMGVAA